MNNVKIANLRAFKSSFKSNFYIALKWLDKTSFQTFSIQTVLIFDSFLFFFTLNTAC